jgi:prevent-host-death family protein
MVLMKTTKVTDLRTHLSRFLDAVRHGEEVEILDRSVPIARLVPVTPATKASRSGMPPWLERLRRTGGVRVGSLKPVAEILRGFPRGTRLLGDAAVEAILEERRAER